MALLSKREISRLGKEEEYREYEMIIVNEGERERHIIRRREDCYFRNKGWTHIDR